MPGDPQKTAKLTREKLHRVDSRYGSLGPAQAEYILGTSHHCHPEQFKLLLDHAGEWYRSTKDVQKNQEHAEDQMY